MEKRVADRARRVCPPGCGRVGAVPRAAPKGNGDAHPIEGVVAVVDLVAHRVMELVGDGRIIPVPRTKRSCGSDSLGVPRCGWHVTKRGTRFGAAQALAMAVRQQCGPLSAGAARGLGLRHDHGSSFMAGRFQKQARFWGISPSHAFIGEPETKGVMERFFRTLKEQAMDLAHLADDRLRFGDQRMDRCRERPSSLDRAVHVRMR